MAEKLIEKQKNQVSAAPCENCPVHHAANLLKLGVDMANWDFAVALAGNPNTGKSTVFNALTGLRQHTGNWPGKTVTRAEGGFEYAGNRYKLVDLPGTYSLLATSLEACNCCISLHANGYGTSSCSASTRVDTAPSPPCCARCTTSRNA